MGTKKKLSVIRVLCLIAGVTSIYCGLQSAVFAQEGNACEAPVIVSKKISRGKIFSNGIMCMETFECFPEESHLSKRGKEFYTKTVKILREFRKKKDDSSFKTKAQYQSEITFTYDKKSFVKIKDSERDVRNEKKSDGWKMMDLNQILSSQDVCVSSHTCTLYKEFALGTNEYLGNSHMDIFCSVLGNIGINTEIH